MLTSSLSQRKKGLLLVGIILEAVGCVVLWLSAIGLIIAAARGGADTSTKVIAVAFLALGTNLIIGAHQE